MTMLLAALPPFGNFIDLSGYGLSGGMIYIGNAGQDPQTNPQALYWDSAGTIAASQPLAVTSGYITNAGSVATPYLGGAFSIRVLDSASQLVFGLSNVSPTASAADLIAAVAEAQASAAAAAASATAAALAAAAAQSNAAADAMIYPTTADALSNGVIGTTALVAGSGGTNGTFALAFSGGGGTNATGYFVVTGGAVTDIVLTFTGYNYATAPTISFAASTGLTGASATAVIGQNVAVGMYFLTPSASPDADLDLYFVTAGPTATLVKSIGNHLLYAAYEGDEPVLVEEYSISGLVLQGYNRDTSQAIVGGKLAQSDPWQPVPVATANRIDKTGTLYQSIETGQSYGGGAVQSATRAYALTTSSDYGNLTFAGSGNIRLASTTFGGLTALVAGAFGETALEQAAEQLSQAWCRYDLDDPLDRRVFVSSAYDDGQALSVYTYGTSHYNTVTAVQVADFASTAAGLAYVPRVMTLTVIGGQTDQTNNVAAASIETDANALVNGINTTVAAQIPAQTGKVHTLWTQPCYKQNQPNHGYSLGVLNVCRTNALSHFIGPDFALFRLDVLHPYDSYEYQYCAQYVARAQFQLWQDQEPWQVRPSSAPYIIGKEFYWPMRSPTPLRFEGEIVPFTTDYGLAIEDNGGVKLLDRVFIGADEQGRYGGFVLRATLNATTTGDVECRLGLDYNTPDLGVTGGRYHNLTDSTDDMAVIMRGDSPMTRRMPYWAPYALQAVQVRS